MPLVKMKSSQMRVGPESNDCYPHTRSAEMRAGRGKWRRRRGTRTAGSTRRLAGAGEAGRALPRSLGRGLLAPRLGECAPFLLTRPEVTCHGSQDVHTCVKGCRRLPRPVPTSCAHKNLDAVGTVDEREGAEPWPAVGALQQSPARPALSGRCPGDPGGPCFLGGPRICSPSAATCLSRGSCSGPQPSRRATRPRRRAGWAAAAQAFPARAWAPALTSSALGVVPGAFTAEPHPHLQNRASRSVPQSRPRHARAGPRARGRPCGCGHAEGTRWPCERVCKGRRVCLLAPWAYACAGFTHVHAAYGPRSTYPPIRAAGVKSRRESGPPGVYAGLGLQPCLRRHEPVCTRVRGACEHVRVCGYGVPRPPWQSFCV